MEKLEFRLQNIITLFTQLAIKIQWKVGDEYVNYSVSELLQMSDSFEDKVEILIEVITQWKIQKMMTFLTKNDANVISTLNMKQYNQIFLELITQVKELFTDKAVGNQFQVYQTQIIELEKLASGTKIKSKV